MREIINVESNYEKKERISLKKITRVNRLK